MAHRHRRSDFSGGVTAGEQAAPAAFRHVSEAFLITAVHARRMVLIAAFDDFPQ